MAPPALQHGKTYIMQHKLYPSVNHKFVLERLNNGNVCLLNAKAGRGHVRIMDNGVVDFRGGTGKWAQFVVHSIGDYVAFQSVANAHKQWHIGISNESLTGKCALGDAAAWSITKTDGVALPASTDPPFFAEAMLSSAQKQHFVNLGFIHVPNVVSSDLVGAALRVINHQLGQQKVWETNAEGREILAGNWQQSPEITNLLYLSPAYTLAQRLVGVGKLSKPQQGQIALRMPVYPPPSIIPTLPGTQWHMDGFGKGKHSPFTLLLGITLSDCSEEFSGNFVTFPGSHISLREHVKQQVYSDQPIFSQENDATKPDLSPGFQVKAKAGDIVMAHQKLAHRGGPNYSPNTRYQVYFRLRHVYHADLAMAALDDIWVEYEGLR